MVSRETFEGLSRPVVTGEIIHSLVLPVTDILLRVALPPNELIPAAKEINV